MTLQDVLAQVVDPEFDLTLGELGMVDRVEETPSQVLASILLPGLGYQRVDELRVRILDSLETAGKTGTVDLEFSPMDEVRQLELSLKLTGALQRNGHSDNGGGHDHPGSGGPISTNLPASCRVLGISSGKGGVGKSSVTVNLAVALAKRGKTVAVLDADVYGFSVPGMLGITQPPMALDRLVIPPKSQGIRCLSMGYFVAEDQPVIWRGPMLHKALEQFLTDSWWGPVDFLVVDMPPGTGDVTLSLAQYLPEAEIFVVTTPQPAAQRVAQRSAFASKKLKLTVRGVIENMSWFRGDDSKRYEIFGSGGGQVLADTISAPLIGQIPISVDLREAGDNGTMADRFDQVSEVRDAFLGLADKIITMRPTKRRSSELKVVGSS